MTKECWSLLFNQAAVSIKRIENFLLQEDLDPDNVQTNPNIGKVVQFFCYSDV